jgi:hypothetical protein
MQGIPESRRMPMPMPEPPPEVTVDDVRARMRAAGVRIPEERLELVRGFLRDALRPIRALDSRAARALEPAVTFDAAAEEPSHGRG